jgi:acetolactate synthase-1/2/3 large subunit
VLNIVGDHATYHAQHDPPLQSDIETIARNVSTWVRTSRTARELTRDAVDAIAAATGPPGGVATLIVPADLSWQDGVRPANPSPPVEPRAAPGQTVDAVATAIRDSHRTGILLGGRSLRGEGLLAAARIAAATGAKLFSERSTPRLERGAGLPPVERLAYWPELAARQLAELTDLVLVDANPPVAWFAYPGANSTLAPADCRLHELVPPTADVLASLEALVEALDAASAKPSRQARVVAPRPTGSLTAEKVCQAIGAVLPEGAIISDEAITSAATLPANTVGSPRHDWLTLTGGAIGQGLPVAVGAAIACPDRPVIALEADGSAQYTIQSLWTMACEQLDVTVVLFNNRGYGILRAELGRLGEPSAGARARALLDLGNPEIDFSKLGNGFGVPSQRVDRAEELIGALENALTDPGPHLIEAVLPAVSGP